MAPTEVVTYTRPCACGCGENVPAKRYPSWLARYIAGHSPVRNKWTAEERAFLRENYDRMTSDEMASALGKTRESIASMANKIMGLRKGGCRYSLVAAFDRHTPIRPADGCWEWTGSLTADGYGVVSHGSKRWLAHRLSVYLSRGRLGKSDDVLHRCDNKRCANPSHLYVGNDRENMRDRAERCGHPMQRLSPAAALEIREAHAAGTSRADLAVKYGVAPAVIHHVIARRSWAWVEERMADTTSEASHV